jgi:SPP1 gp7 family putative phage head morphogenesis protein
VAATTCTTQMIRDKNRREIILKAVRPNAGMRASYRRRLLALIDDMQASYDRFLLAAYKKNEPEMAADALPATELKRALAKLARRWKKQFAETSERLAEYFAKAAANRSDAQLRSILRKGGWTVKFKMTAPMRDVMTATIAENVGLIRSIPEEFHRQVEGLVMRGVTAGRDLHVISEGLQKQLGVAKRRAEFISRDQTNKMNASFTRVRQIEIGVTEAIWLHSGGGKTPRPTHVKNSGKRYNIRTGWYDPSVKKFIQPGELISCRCVARPVIKGFS